ncbi:MAG TPA: thiamine pyrophosphate-binding protein [Candidatus Binatia bacterium]|jgi:sulfopyruvate decarboxylase TPP-binding subunit
MEPDLANKIVSSLKGAGVNFITYVPETRLSEMLPIIQKDEFFRLVPVASEAEAVGIAAGASMAGKQSAAYMEGPGVWVSAYNLVTVGIRYGVPLLLLVGYVGSMADKRNTFLYAEYGIKMIDELKSMGIEYEILRDGDKLETKIADAVRMMNALKKPVALLFTGEFTI